MADRWMDERDREWRERDWRRSEEYGRGGRGDDERRFGYSQGRGEDRTWSGAADDNGGAYEDAWRGQGAYGEDDEDYGGGSDPTSGGGYGGESYGRGGVGRRSQAYQSGSVQARYGGQEPRFTPQRGRGYADEVRGGHSRSWDDERDRSYNRELERDDLGRSGMADDYEPDRAYGQSSRSEQRGREPWRERGQQVRGGEGAGDFLHRAGERISSWFRGDNLMRGGQRDDRDARTTADRGHRGMGPKGYKRSDERINDEVHQRLTDDPWLDASNIQVEVKGGEVTLSGHVDNREAKHRAERLIEELSGVSHVQNNLRVDPNLSFTGAGRGFGSSALEAEMRRNEQALGATGSSPATATETSTDPKTGSKRTQRPDG